MFLSVKADASNPAVTGDDLANDVPATRDGNGTSEFGEITAWQ
jgi:hypothetical protein